MNATIKFIALDIRHKLLDVLDKRWIQSQYRIWNRIFCLICLTSYTYISKKSHIIPIRWSMIYFYYLFFVKLFVGYRLPCCNSIPTVCKIICTLFDYNIIHMTYRVRHACFYAMIFGRYSYLKNTRIEQISESSRNVWLFCVSSWWNHIRHAFAKVQLIYCY